MESIRKQAYKVLIHQALLDTKNCNDTEEIFHIAHTFHNLTETLVEDFKGYNEEALWSRISFLEENFGLMHYRRMFEETIKRMSKD
ncbi:hypothetical protein J5Y03_17330 [Bacillus sp. RG28]|uniref:Uncharacterized protein n=1 Tax=Gottfriedia endophytica TaxID=2820819 RepID=A0A940NSV2_9BACI|nr:hypothetical protein [Gottfriedia endophytica]MBP0726923.1 hypothetical protein [Gottfriedia endophytica]